MHTPRPRRDRKPGEFASVGFDSLKGKTLSEFRACSEEGVLIVRDTRVDELVDRRAADH